MRTRTILGMALVACAFVIFAEEALLKNADVIQMVQAGISPAVIQAKIASAKTAFDTSTSALAELTKAKVPDSVITAMIAIDSASSPSGAHPPSSPTPNALRPSPPIGQSRSEAFAAREQELRGLERRISEPHLKSPEEFQSLLDTYRMLLLELRRCQADSACDHAHLTPLFPPTGPASLRLAAPPGRDTGDTCYCIVDYKGPIKVLKKDWGGGLSEEHWREEFPGIDINERTIGPLEGGRDNRSGPFSIPPGEHSVTIFCSAGAAYWHRNSISASFMPGQPYRLMVKAGGSFGLGGVTILGIELDR